MRIFIADSVQKIRLRLLSGTNTEFRRFRSRRNRERAARPGNNPSLTIARPVGAAPLSSFFRVRARACRAALAVPAVVCALLAGASAFAQTAAPLGPGGHDTHAAEAPAVAGDGAGTGVFTDPATGTIRVLIGGEEIVVIDETGLYVRGDIAYRGTMTDGLPERHKAEGGDAD